MDASFDLSHVEIAPFDFNTDEEDFLTLTMAHLPRFYEDVDESFGRSILETHRLGYDPVGHFTKRKAIYRVLYRKQRIGYAVVTEKRGNCVKIGPTILYEEWRGKGIGTHLRSIFHERYRAQNARKAYSTVADNKLDSYRYLVKSGYTVEAHLRAHYSAGHGELVFGRFLEPGTFYLGHEPQLAPSLPCRIVNRTDECRPLVGRYLLAGMADSFSEIDDSFIEALFLAEDRGQQFYANKGKRIFVALGPKGVCGVAVTTAKRGGAVKVAPLIAGASNVAAELIASIEKYYTQTLRSRKIYVLMPFHHSKLTRVLAECGLSCEGLLREPYKRGVDLRVMSRFLSLDERPVLAPDIVLSILPDPVGRILAGRKSFEIRKSFPSAHLQGMYLYTTGSTRAFQCYVKTPGYFRLPKDRLWAVVGERAAPRERFFDYLRDYSLGYAIAISRVCRFRSPISLADARRIDTRFTVPRQLFYVDSSSALTSRLEQARAEGTWFDTGVEQVIDRFREDFVAYQ